MAWMAWTTPTAIFFVTIAIMLAAMTVWELRSPGVPRRGLLPMVTTRGDRLFIGLLGAAFVNLSWLGLVGATQWVGLALGLLWMFVVGRWG